MALIGCGYWGKNIARTLNEIGHLAAISDYDPSVAKPFAETYGCKALTIDEVPGIG